AGCGGEGNQGRRAIGGLQSLQGRWIEGISVERLRRRPIEVATPQERRERAIIHPPALPERTVDIERLAGVAHRPVVDHGVARTGVEGNEFALDALVA